MSHRYQAVGWNANKIGYDLILVALVVGYLYLYHLAVAATEGPRLSGPTVDARAYGSCAFLMLTSILCIGPLARLDDRFLPLLYNRRHFGVITCIVALLHVDAVLDWYHDNGPVGSLLSLLDTMTRGWGAWQTLPFEAFGAVALLILAVMAVTSHDFWLAFLTPPVWKALHMGVYVAFAALVLHVAFGALQKPAVTGHTLGVMAAAGLVIVLHLLAGWREWQRDRRTATGARDGVWLNVGKATHFAALAEGRAHMATLPDGERVAIFRHRDQLSAVANACAHQNGPLGEGRIIDGCITCPWHGFQYYPHNGTSPPPFTEKIPTYRLRWQGDELQVHGEALPPGTAVEPLGLAEAQDTAGGAER
ncbi:MAG: Rieske 2Fe-2S domain-containing protein [Candidatus Competibacterales bacterium]